MTYRSDVTNAVALGCCWPDDEGVGGYYDSIGEAAQILADIEETPGFEWGEYMCPTWEFTCEYIVEELVSGASPLGAVRNALRASYRLEWEWEQKNGGAQ